MGRAALEQLLAGGAHLRAGSLAVRLGDFDVLSEAALVLVRNTLASLPVDTAGAWLSATPPAERCRPELVLLAAAAAHAMCDTDPAVEEQLEAALAGFRAHPGEGDTSPAELVVLGLQLLVAHTRGGAARRRATRGGRSRRYLLR